ncbi:hypothetical protein FACS1894161_0450 [Spirochaetia bacterium]|nr:hypothetical protein FACS1894161_0450 [Spirochaetia bacterium]
MEAVSDYMLLIPSFSHSGNNTALDERVKTFMRRNNLIYCMTGYPNGAGVYTNIVNYSLDNYKIFGFMSINLLEK